MFGIVWNVFFHVFSRFFFYKLSFVIFCSCDFNVSSCLWFALNIFGAKLRDATKEEAPTSLRIIMFSGIRVLVFVVGVRKKKNGIIHEPHSRNLKYIVD